MKLKTQLTGSKLKAIHCRTALIGMIGLSTFFSGCQHIYQSIKPRVVKAKLSIEPLKLDAIGREIQMITAVVKKIINNQPINTNEAQDLVDFIEKYHIPVKIQMMRHLFLQTKMLSLLKLVKKALKVKIARIKESIQYHEKELSKAQIIGNRMQHRTHFISSMRFKIILRNLIDYESKLGKYIENPD